MTTKTINLNALYCEFHDFLGLGLDEDPTRRHFPEFRTFVKECHSELVGLEFKLWSDLRKYMQ